MKRSLFAISMSMMLMLSLAGPAFANPESATPKVIVIPAGVANVGKSITNWTDTGCTSVSGGGLGLPIISQAKNAYFQLVTQVTFLPNVAAGALNVCGRLGPTLDNLIYIPGNTKKGIGASCGMSKGYDGKGRIIGQAPKGGDHWLTDVGWKNSAGGLLPVTGKIHTGAAGKAPVDGFVGIVVAQGGAPCPNKRDNPKLPPPIGAGPKQSGQGAVTFTVAGVVVVVPGGAFLGNRNDLPGSPKGSNDMPLFCKKAKKDGDPCLYQTKKREP